MILNSISDKALKILKNKTFNYKEEWRYTNINNLKKIKHFKDYLNTESKFNDFNNDISIYNNHQIKNNILNKNISITNISNSLNQNLFNCTEIFNKITTHEKNEFILYNTAYFKKGIFVNINSNANIKKPIHINNIVNYSSSDDFINFRYLFKFGANNNLKIILKDAFLTKINLNTLIEIVIEENSTIDIVIESDKKNITQILNLSATIKSDSELNIFTINMNGKLIRNNYLINLEYVNSKYNYSGINLLSANNHIDDFIEINHKNKYTSSTVYQKNILRENAKSIFYCKTIIDKKSSFSEVEQNNKNIMLTSKGVVHSNPQLEIHNNDVKCSHGSTTGTLDDEALFYLQSRGIKLENAKKMLLSGFLNEFISSLNIDEYTEKINNKINNWL